MDIRASLEALCSCPGPSGREDAVASQAMELLRPLVDEVQKDRFGNVIGIRRCGAENAKRVVLDAHLDEVGLVITGAKDGFLRFRPVGGVDPRMLPNREVTILSPVSYTHLDVYKRQWLRSVLPLLMRWRMPNLMFSLRNWLSA